jgi:phage terminase large subunit GpA-like protein
MTLRQPKQLPTAFPPTPPTPSDYAARGQALRQNIPVIVCTTGSDAPYRHQAEFGTWKFKCSHCGESHHHGAGEGFRSANCSDPTSPYHDSGYYVLHADYA